MGVGQSWGQEMSLVLSSREDVEVPELVQVRNGPKSEWRQSQQDVVTA